MDTSSHIQPPPPLAETVIGKKPDRNGKHRKRNTSSGSLSEEDVFASLSESRSSPSPPQYPSTPDYSPPLSTKTGQVNGEKKEKKSKKKKRNKGKGRKDSGSGSDGEGVGNGRSNGQQDSELKRVSFRIIIAHLLTFLCIYMYLYKRISLVGIHVHVHCV